MRHFLGGVVFTAIVIIACFLVPSKNVYAYYYENLEASDETVTVYVGEKISLYHYAPTGGTDTYRLGSGTGVASFDAESGVIFFTKSGTLFVQDDVRDVSGNIVATKTWSFVIINNKPVITKEPESVSGYYQDSVTFSVETRQDSTTLKYSWFIVHSNSMQSYPRTSFEVDSWDESTLTIHNLQFWMNGVRVYCMISSADKSDLIVFTQSDPISSAPQLQVVKRPIDNVLYLTDFNKAVAKDPLDYSFVISQTNNAEDAYSLVKVSNLTYKRGDEKLNQNSNVALGDEISVTFTLSLTSKNNYSFPETLTFVWGDLRTNATIINSSTAEVKFDYVITECNPNYISDLPLTYSDLHSNSNILPKELITSMEDVSVENLVWEKTEDAYQVSFDLISSGNRFFDDLTAITIHGLFTTHNIEDSNQKVHVVCLYPLSADGAMILEQPASTGCYDGDSVSFHVEAFYAKSYQWYMIPYGSDVAVRIKDDKHFHGTQTNTLVISADVEFDLSCFYCVINDVETEKATLKVHINPNVGPWGPGEEWQDYGWRVVIYIFASLVISAVGIWLLLKSVFGKWYKKDLKKK